MSPRNRLAGAASAAVTLPFLPVLTEAFRHTQQNGLQTYAPLVPVVAAYVAWRTSPEAAVDAEPGSFPILPAAAALLVAAGALTAARHAADPSLSAALSVIAWLALLGGTLASGLGLTGFARWRLPLVILLFIVPLPHAVIVACEEAFQHGSAGFARWLLELHGTPVHLDQLTLSLPGISLWVAPECSGLRSSLVLLFLTVVAAGSLLRTTSTRLALIAAVAPIAVARNGLRIFVIGTMCTREGVAALDSALHRHGGPVFFALSLVPWTLLLAVLWRREARARPSPLPV